MSHIIPTKKRWYAVIYVDKKGKQHTKRVEAVSAWAAKWVLVSEHKIPHTQIITAI